MATNRIPSVDMLRGIAALSVCIFHFTNGNESYFSNNYWLKEIGSVGWAGVEIFFVISGFIIPYSLYTAQYKLKNFGKFLLKRITRIEPPYFLSIVIIIGLNFLSILSAYFNGEPFHVNYLSLALHIGYLNDFFNQPWLNPVFWTLAIEFQFYLLIGLLFPLINHKKQWVFLITIILLFCCSNFAIYSTIFYHLPYFILGIFIFNRKINHLRYIWILEAIVLIAIYLQFSFVPFIAAFFAWAILSFVENWSNKWFLWLGTISYSLYLIHVPFGGRLINLSANFLKTDLSRSFGVLFAIILSLIISYFFYKIIELPSMQFSRSLFMKKNENAT